MALRRRRDLAPAPEHAGLPSEAVAAGFDDLARYEAWRSGWADRAKRLGWPDPSPSLLRARAHWRKNFEGRR